MAHQRNYNLCNGKKRDAKIMTNREQLEESQRNYYNKKSRAMMSKFVPYPSKMLRAAYREKLIPSFLSQSRLTSILNAIECEAHNDILRWSLWSKIRS